MALADAYGYVLQPGTLSFFHAYLASINMTTAEKVPFRPALKFLKHVVTCALLHVARCSVSRRLRTGASVFDVFSRGGSDERDGRKRTVGALAWLFAELARSHLVQSAGYRSMTSLCAVRY